MGTEPFSRMIAVADVPPHGTDVTLEPDAPTRDALARFVAVVGLPAFKAVLHVAPEGEEGLHVTGRLDAEVTQTCVVTLEPFTAPLSEEIDVYFAPESAIAALLKDAEEDEDAEGEDDPPDAIVDGAVDLGVLVTEFLSLGIDPYPRKPGAVFEQPEQEGATISPFSELARLKGKT